MGLSLSFVCTVLVVAHIFSGGIGASWAGWHALRHTYASIHLANGVSLLALSRALGHHSPSFTLDTYAHLLDGDQAPALDLGTGLGTKAHIEPTSPNESIPLKTAA